MFASLLRRSPSPRPSRRPGRRPAVEVLEGRQLMALGSEFRVNSTEQGFQGDSDNASSANGTSIAVWVDTSHGDADVRAQRYNAAGNKVGPETFIAGRRGVNESQPAVAMDPLGNYTVSWTEAQPGGDTNVLARKFRGDGSAAGPLVLVAGGLSREYEPDVAMDARGGFAVSYTRDTTNTNPDLFARRYNASSQLTRVATLADSFKAERRSSIAMAPDGRFSVAYEYQYSSMDTDIYVAKCTAAGNLLGSRPVAISAAQEQAPSIAMDDAGNAVIAYQKVVGADYDIKARRVTSAGLVGGELTIRATTANETAPAVALMPTGGAFVVAYNGPLSVEVVPVTGMDGVATTPWRAGANRISPAISINPAGRLLLTSTSLESGGADIYARRGTL